MLVHLDGGFRIEEQKLAVATATAVRDPVQSFEALESEVLESAMASRAVEAHGRTNLRQRLHAWLALNVFAPIRSRWPARTPA